MPGGRAGGAGRMWQTARCSPHATVARTWTAAGARQKRLPGVDPVAVVCSIGQQEGDWIMARLILLVVTLAFAVPPVSAEIVKCVAKDGTDLYQNFPCGIDSIGSMATSAPSEKAGVAPSDPKQAKANGSLPAAASTGKSPTMPGEPRIGMTGDEVKTLWGEPEEMIEDEPATGGRVSNWRYADGRSVQLNNKHRVLAVQR